MAFKSGQFSNNTVKGSPVKTVNNPASKSKMSSPAIKPMNARTSFNPMQGRNQVSRPFAPATPKSSQPRGRTSGSKFTAGTGGARSTEVPKGAGRPGNLHGSSSGKGKGLGHQSKKAQG